MNAVACKMHATFAPQAPVRMNERSYIRRIASTCSYQRLRIDHASGCETVWQCTYLRPALALVWLANEEPNSLVRMVMFAHQASTAGPVAVDLLIRGVLHCARDVFARIIDTTAAHEGP